MGDTDVVATYSDYKDFSGVQFPTKILIEQGGFPLWDLNITSVMPNASADLPVPEVVASTVPAVQTMSAKLANGVWHVTGGSHHSVVVEFNDHVAVIEAPLDEARSLAVIAEAKKLVPNKPLKYVLTTHHHFDHSGGLHVCGRGCDRRHASIQRALLREDTGCAGDAQPRCSEQGGKDADAARCHRQGHSHRRQTDDRDLRDGGDTHTNEYTLIHLPGPRIVVEADAYSLGRPNAPVPPMPPPNAVALYDELQKLKLNVATIAPIHGRGAVPFAEFRKFVGK